METYEENDGSDLVVEEDKEHLDPSVSQINSEAEIELAEAMEAAECKICEGVGKVENARGFMVPCQDCSVDYNAD